MNSLRAQSIQTDISKVVAGDWFLPMTLKDVDQHALIPEALEKGAVGFCYEESRQTLVEGLLGKIPTFAVPNLRTFLFDRAIEQRAKLQTEIAVIAGSAGKTSVKELVGSILRTWNQESFVSPENQNTKIALATQILRLPENTPQGVFEMGARRTGDFLIPLSYLQPSVVALLNVGSAHVGEFGSRAILTREKLSCLNAVSVETIVVPGDSSEILQYAQTTGKILWTFGFHSSNKVQIISETANQVSLQLGEQVYDFHLGFQSASRALNLSAAVAVAAAMKVPWEFIVKGLESFQGVPRRFQQFSWNQMKAVDDAYNSSPESLKEGLYQIQKMSMGQRLLLVLGSMLELGEHTEDAHREVALQIREISKTCSELALVTVGREAALIADELHNQKVALKSHQHFNSSSEAKSLNESPAEYDWVYFKASKSIQLNAIFGDV